ncbi:MAG: putative lipid II flippase FtsW [Microbacteriaceae bacterium]
MAKPKSTKRQPKLRTQDVAEAANQFFQGFFKAQSREFNLLIALVIFLVGVGLLMVLSASFVDALKSSNNAFAIFNKQLITAVLGALALFVLASMPPDAFKRLVIPASGLALAVQFLTVFTPLGTSVNGNRNWINLFGFTIQPSEFLKLFLIVYTANFIQDRQAELDDPKRVWFPLMAIALVFMFPVLLGGDVGTVIVMAAFTFGLWSVAGLPQRLVNALVVLAVVAIPVVMFSNGSRRGRVLAWLNPTAADPNDYNWQATHGIWAFAAGGLGGVGLGQSKLKWSWIPEAENDFIFAIIGEELGLIGAITLIVLFVVLAFVMIRIAMRTNDIFKRMIVLGVMLWISLQAFINIAVVLTLLPVLGVPLPLISAGGSSLLATLMAFGVVLSIERENHRLGAVSTRRSRR